MKTIYQLDDTEAVYSLYLAAEPHGDQLNLDDPATVRQTVRDAFASVTNPAIADQVMARLNDEHSAADVTRAALAVLREQKNLSPDVAIRIDAMLADPPHADKMDLGVSLSLLAFGALAMALMGTLEVKHEEMKGPAGEMKKSTSVKWKGSQNIPKLVSGILGKLGLPGGK